jgi:hypothetical protein
MVRRFYGKPLARVKGIQACYLTRRPRPAYTFFPYFKEAFMKKFAMILAVGFVLSAGVAMAEDTTWKQVGKDAAQPYTDQYNETKQVPGKVQQDAKATGDAYKQQGQQYKNQANERVEGAKSQANERVENTKNTGRTVKKQADQTGRNYKKRGQQAAQQKRDQANQSANAYKSGAQQQGQQMMQTGEEIKKDVTTVPPPPEPHK